jgi:hypothetical protein
MNRLHLRLNPLAVRYAQVNKRIGGLFERLNEGSIGGQACEKLLQLSAGERDPFLPRAPQMLPALPPATPRDLL